ncbi:hypothetical protein Tco_0462650 [Tanacetum coccineum]
MKEQVYHNKVQDKDTRQEKGKGNVTSLNPTIIQGVNHMAHDLMDLVVRAKAARNADNKRKWDDNHRYNFGQQQNKRQKVVRAYTAGLSDKKEYP